MASCSLARLSLPYGVFGEVFAVGAALARADAERDEEIAAQPAQRHADAAMQANVPRQVGETRRRDGFTACPPFLADVFLQVIAVGLLQQLENGLAQHRV